MSGFKNFAIVGAGNIGMPIAEAFLAAKTAGKADEIIVLTRPESAPNDAMTALAVKGARIVPVDYTSVTALTSVLNGVDAVVSTVGHSAFGLQIPLAQAATAAGVQLFVPSEFGMASDAMPEPLNKKKQLADAIRAVGIPTTVFFSGCFADWMWQPMAHLDIKSGKVSVGGNGDAKISFTSRPDVARFVAHALTTFAPEDLKDKTIRIEGERASFNEVFKAYEANTGKKLEVTYIPVEELQAKLASSNGQDVISLFHFLWAEGMGAVGEPLDNNKWPEWNPSKVVDNM